jgi:hypothetical protein
MGVFWHDYLSAYLDTHHTEQTFAKATDSEIHERSFF